MWVNSEAILKECIVGVLTGSKRRHKRELCDGGCLLVGVYRGTVIIRGIGGLIRGTVAWFVEPLTSYSSLLPFRRWMSCTLAGRGWGG